MDTDTIIIAAAAVAGVCVLATAYSFVKCVTCPCRIFCCCHKSA